MKNSFSPLLTKPRIGITMGDPAGIGPEILLKTVAATGTALYEQVLVIGEIEILEKTMHDLHLSIPLCTSVEPNHESHRTALTIFDCKTIGNNDFVLGTVEASCGAASYTYILKAIHLARQGIIHAIVTNPINKLSLHKAEIPFWGHTEIFTHELNVKNSAMMFVLEDVCVAHVTGHCSVRDAVNAICQERVFQTILLLRQAVHDFGISNGRLAVCGLNPHAGESGMFGTEEINHISPAIAQAQAQGINVTGPYPADSVFMRAFKGEFDGIIAMLHDQGYGALKSRNFSKCVQLTIGLPFIRTSVGHGTAFDIAGKGIATPDSLLEAITVAQKMLNHKFNL